MTTHQKLIKQPAKRLAGALTDGDALAAEAWLHVYIALIAAERV